MKFWVKAVVDSAVQEQLLVSASSLDELHAELEALLDLSIFKMSLTDFQSEVVDRLSDTSTDIISISIQSSLNAAAHTSTGSSFSSPSEMSVAMRNHNRRVLSAPTQLGGGREIAPVAAPAAAVGTTTEDDLGDTLSFMNLGGSPTSEERGAHGPSLRLARNSRLNKHSLLDVPQIEKICLKRDHIVLLLNSALGTKFHSVLCGCFARVREVNGYVIYQVASITSERKIIFDRIYSSDKRELDTVSNANPMKDEINAWMKRMLACSRPYPSNGFLEAKHGDVLSALRSASAVSSPTVQVAVSEQPMVIPLSSQERELGSNSMLEEVECGFRTRKGSLVEVEEEEEDEAGVEVNEGSKELSIPLAYTPADNSPTPLLNGAFSDSGSAFGPQPPPPPPKEERRVRRFTTSALSVCSPMGKIAVPVNDYYSNVDVLVQPCTAHGVCHRILATATRQANSSTVNGRNRRPLRSDFAGCVLLLDLNEKEVLRDRDITEKGFKVFHYPVRWGERYIALGQRCPAAGAALHYDEGSRHFVQHVTVLTGPQTESLYSSFSTSLPIPAWCRNPEDALITQAKLVVHRGSLHVFYVIHDGSAAEDAPFSSQLAPLEPTFSGGCAATVPLTLRSLTSLSVTPNRSLAPLDASALASVDKSAAESYSIASISPPHSSRMRSVPLDGGSRYSLAHAVTTDVILQSDWQLLSVQEGLCTSDEEPVFTVGSLSETRRNEGMPSWRCRDDRRSASLPDAGGFVASELNILWSASRPHSSHSNSPSKALHPVRPTLSKHKDGALPHPSKGSTFPLLRLVNASNSSAAHGWREEPLYNTARAEIKVSSSLISLSLSVSPEGSTYLTCGYHSETKLTFVTLPASS